MADKPTPLTDDPQIAAEQDKVKTEPHPLARLPKERDNHHRALLLYVACDPDKRKYTVVARAVGAAEATARSWRTRHKWKDRIAAAGATAPQFAIRLYRDLYLNRIGGRELAAIGPYSSTPVLPDDPIQQTDDAVRAASEISASKSKEVEARAKYLESTASLIDATLSAFAADLRFTQTGQKPAQGKVERIKVQPRDLPALIAMGKQLKDEARSLRLGSGESSQGGQVVESYRVRQARANGSDILEAVHTDVQDLNAILTALRGQRTSDQEIKSIVDEAETSGTGSA